MVPWKHSSTVQQLAYRGWHQVNRQEVLLTGVGRGGGRWWSWGLSAIGDGEHAATSLMPDDDGTGSGSLLDSILSTFLKKLSSDIWVVALFFSSRTAWWCWIAFWTAATTFLCCSMFGSWASKTHSASSYKENPLAIHLHHGSLIL